MKKRKAYRVAKKPNTNKIYQYKSKKDNYLKNLRVVRYFIQRKYNISFPILELLLYLYDLPLFSKKEFVEFEETMSWNKKRWDYLIKEDLIKEWRERSSDGKALYELTHKAKRICNLAYKKLNQDEPISENKYLNTIFKGENYMDKIYRRMIRKMNAS